MWESRDTRTRKRKLTKTSPARNRHCPTPHRSRIEQYIDLRSVRSVKRVRRRAVSQARERDSGAWHLVLETPSREWDLFPEPRKADVGKGEKERKDKTGIKRQRGSGKRFRMNLPSTGTAGPPVSVPLRVAEELVGEEVGGEIGGEDKGEAAAEGGGGAGEEGGKGAPKGAASLATAAATATAAVAAASIGTATPSQPAEPTAKELDDAQRHRSMVWYSALFKELMEFLVVEDRLQRTGAVTSSKAAAIFSTPSERAAARHETGRPAKKERSFGKGVVYANQQVAHDYESVIGKVAGI